MKVLTCEVRVNNRWEIRDQLSRIADRIEKMETVGWDIGTEPPTGFSFTFLPLEGHRAIINQKVEL